MCMAVMLSGLMFSGCGKSSDGGGGAAVVSQLWYLDSDGDGFGTPTDSQNTSDQPDGYVDNNFDCNDANANINPSAGEVSDGLDNNCNDEIDESPKAGIIPDTGQSTSYTNTFGEDSDYIIDSPSYTKLDENGQELPFSAATWHMVKDNVTGLIWELKTASDGVKNPLNIHDADNKYTYEDATSGFIASLNDQDFGHFSDGYAWRIPSIKELCYLANSSLYNPCISSNYFPLVPTGFIWSETIHPSNTDQAWVFLPYWGLPYSTPKTTETFVWAVRGEEIITDLEEYGPHIIKDNATGLMWQKATAKGDEDEGMNFTDALQYCENLELGGYKDWRLPNRNELTSIIRFSSWTPAIADSLFPDTMTSMYWTSTTLVAADSSINSNGNNAWQINFSMGSIFFGKKTDLAFVKAVRGGNNTTTTTWYRDSDGDHYGDISVKQITDASSSQPVGYVLNNTDCDDLESGISPAAAEIPDDGIDQNCSGVDELTWYYDEDGDGFGNESISTLSESQPAIYVHDSDDIATGRFDCDDTNTSINPDMEEIPDDGIDNDCNGKESLSWYQDDDGDGYGSGLRIDVGEDAPSGGSYAANDLDCNDLNMDIHPGLVEIFNDTLDTNCNGEIDDSSLQIIPDTGQTGSYTDVSGEDSDFLINPQSFTKISSIGTPLDLSSTDWSVIRDNVTGLYWEVISDSNVNTTRTFFQAKTYAQNLSLAGYDDWRLPTVAELASIANLEMSRPAIDMTYFPNTQTNRYWTSSDSGSETQSITVNFRYSEGSIQSKTAPYCVRSVRGGNTSDKLVVNGDGTVTETVSGLTWNDNVDITADWNSTFLGWNTICDGQFAATCAGYNDWRFPSEKDALSLITIFKQSPSLSMSDYFSVIYSRNYWSSTLSPSDSTKAVYYSLITGETGTADISAVFVSMGVRGTRSSRFIDSGDPDDPADDAGSTIFDKKTGLMWLKKNGNSGIGVTFEGALYICNNLILGGYEDWRLPNRNEMLSLLEASMDDISGYEAAFPDTKSFYWTSSSSSAITDNAWQINFTKDAIELSLGSYSNENIFRAVRGGDIE